MFPYQIRFAVKKNIFWGKFSKLIGETFVPPSKNASHTFSIYGNCMMSIFFSNNKNLGIKQPLNVLTGF